MIKTNDKIVRRDLWFHDSYPFSLRRLPLSFRADFYLPSNNGFICASDEGCIAFLDLLGNYLGEINLDCYIIAIAPIEDDQFVVVVENEGKKMRQFYQVELAVSQKMSN